MLPTGAHPGYARKHKGRDLNRYLPAMFPAALSAVAKRRKPLNYPSTHEWTHKMWHIHALEYYSTLKVKKIATRATTQMNLRIFY